MNVVVVARDHARRQALIQQAEDAGWTVRADVPTEAALSPEDLDGVAAIVIDARDTTVASSRIDEETDSVESLTAREREVLEQMAAGLSNRQIADVLDISEHTVKFHVSAILGKLGVSSRSAAIRHGLRQGLVTL
ncbi:MAG TPA: LuxR C-terminal-related transcriptional regulator [Vicinamibacterales bacterium]|jgi:DNA-binding CsgD family transcriptional regulator